MASNGRKNKKWYFFGSTTQKYHFFWRSPILFELFTKKWNYLKNDTVNFFNSLCKGFFYRPKPFETLLKIGEQSLKHVNEYIR